MRRASDDEDLAQWLLECGRRSRAGGNASKCGDVTPLCDGADTRPRKMQVVPESWGALARRTALLFIAAFCFLQYHYFDVAIQIGNLPTVLVFVPVKPLT